MRNSLLILFVVLFFGNQTAIGQNRPKSIDEFTRTLQAKGIDTMLIYVNGCSDCMVEVNRPNCHCLDSEVVNEMYFIYKQHGKIFKTDFSCCTGDSIITIKSCKSLPYFIILDKTFGDKNTFLADASNSGKLPVPVPDDAYEDIELITGEKHQRFTLYFDQRHGGHEAWKKYFWIDKQIKLANLVRNDLGLP